jgi:hypothetical protein
MRRREFPDDGFNNPALWPRCALLTPHLIASCEMEMADAVANAERAELLNRGGLYIHRGVREAVGIRRSAISGKMKISS